MRSQVVIVVAPCFDSFPRSGETQEQVLVEAFLAQPCIEAYMDPARAQGCKSADENPVAVIYPALNRSVVRRSRP